MPPAPRTSPSELREVVRRLMKNGIALGALVLVVFVVARGGRLPRDSRLWMHLSVAALFANALPYLLFALGEQQVDSAIAGVLNAIPNASLTELHIERAAVNNAVQDTRIHFTFVYRGA